MESEEPKPEGENLITEKAYKLFKEKKFEDAIAAYQEIYDKHAEWRLRKNSLMMIGLCYDWMGNGEKAIQYLERSIQEYPDRKDYSPATYFYLGQMYAKADQREKALESYKECVQICEMKGMNPESFPLKNARIMLRRLEKPGEYLPPIFNEKLESQEKQEALRKIEQFYKEAKFHQGAIAEIAGLVPEAEHNVPVIVHAAYLASKFSYHTGPLIDIAKLASSCDHECPELYELADLDVMKKSESVRLMQIAESAVKAQSKEEKEKVRQQIEEFKATADYKSIEEALKGQQSR